MRYKSHASYTHTYGWDVGTNSKHRIEEKRIAFCRIFSLRQYIMADPEWTKQSVRWFYNDDLDVFLYIVCEYFFWQYTNLLKVSQSSPIKIENQKKKKSVIFRFNRFEPYLFQIFWRFFILVSSEIQRFINKDLK